MTKLDTSKDKYLLQSLNNALQVIYVLSENSNIGVAEISTISGFDKTSVFKILYTLEKHDFVYKTKDAKYMLGSKFISLGHIVEDHISIVDIANPFLTQLGQFCNETVSFSTLNTNGRTTILDKVEGSNSDSVKNYIGFEIDAHTTATGKVLLAFLDSPMQNSIISNLQFKIYTPQTITSATKLYEVLEEVKNQGYSVDSDERYTGRSTMAAPIFDSTKQCVAAISIVCTNTTFEKNKDNFLREILNISSKISQKLGY